MDEVEDALDEVGVKAIAFGGGGDLLQNLVPAGGLEDSNAVLLFQINYLAADLHARGQGKDQILVQDINLGTELTQTEPKADNDLTAETAGTQGEEKEEDASERTE